MMLWAWAGVPLGVYNIVKDFNIALRIQPQILTLLSLVTWIQCYYYEKVILPRRNKETATALTFSAEMVSLSLPCARRPRRLHHGWNAGGLDFRSAQCAKQEYPVATDSHGCLVGGVTRGGGPSSLLGHLHASYCSRYLFPVRRHRCSWGLVFSYFRPVPTETRCSWSCHLRHRAHLVDGCLRMRRLLQLSTVAGEQTQTRKNPQQRCFQRRSVTRVFEKQRLRKYAHSGAH